MLLKKGRLGRHLPSCGVRLRPKTATTLDGGNRMRVDIYTLFPTAQASVAAAEIAATSATTHLSPEESQRTEKTPRRGPRKRDEPTIVVKRFACIAPVDGQWVLRWEQTTSLSGEPEQYEVETGSESLNLPDSRIGPSPVRWAV